jgi:hypothetical protein
MPPNYSMLRKQAEGSIEACRLRPPAPITAWTRSNVPEEQVVELEKAARAAGLPDGCFSDGVYYIDVDGKKSKEHPGLAPLLDALVVQHNIEVEGKNSVIREVAALPLFHAA